MSTERRPIDDPEVREQHRQQALRSLRSMAIATAAFVALLLAPVGFETLADAAVGPRVPVIVERVDAADGSVTVSGSGRAVPGSMTFAVHDTDAYAVGDHVNAILTGEDPTPTSLDREPILPQLVPIALLFLGLTSAITAIGTVVIVWRAARRRAALRRPWRRAHIVLFDHEKQRCAALLDRGARTYWRLTDIPVDLPQRGALDAQIAGTARRRVMRIFGSTQLVTARRRRARPRWDERFVAATDQPTGESAMIEPRCISVGVSDPRSSSSCLASRK